jgi:hypothetical protein
MDGGGMKGGAGNNEEEEEEEQKKCMSDFGTWEIYVVEKADKKQGGRGRRKRRRRKMWQSLISLSEMSLYTSCAVVMRRYFYPVP